MRDPVFLWLSWVPLLLIVTSTDTHFASSTCLEDQRSLLLQLNSSLVFDPTARSSRLVTWTDGSDCCQWIGVECSDSTGHVVGLDLSGELITEGIDNSSAIFSLQFLRSLNLANNSFSNNAQIPSALGRLSELTYLNLSNAGFSGQVPVEISQLTKLEVLDLSSFSYLGLAPLTMENPRLRTIIQNFTNLRELYLSGVIISANGSEWCNALSSSVPNLQVLSMTNCNISGAIDQTLENLHSLSVIYLDQNNLDAPVPEFLASFRNLTLLKLSNCQLKGTFPQEILKVPTLRSLDLSYNDFLQGTLPEFPINSSLEILVLSFTNFSGQLPDSVGNLKQLQRIESANCSFSGSIQSPLERLSELVHLDLSFNNFSGPIPSFSSAKNITYLDIHDNMLSGTLASTDWKSLLSLVYLDLSCNLLHGSIPMALFSLPELQKVQLNENQFSGQLRDFSDKPSLSLDTLDLTSNNLEGTVPKSIFKLKGLKILKLSCNSFRGSVNLNVIHQLKNLTDLELSFNSFTVYQGSSDAGLSTFPQLRSLGLAVCNLHVLPDFLQNQTFLSFLDLSANQIQGRIPNWIWEVGNGTLSSLNLSSNNFVELDIPKAYPPSLSVLDLHSNNLRGSLPEFPLGAYYLDYSDNNFTSTVPSNIGKSLEYTELLSLARNNISGYIPESLCGKMYLQVLDLSYNQLSGTIPDCLMNMTSTLEILNLRTNNLTGNVPDQFPPSCLLRTLDVNTNNLEGTIPRSLANCRRLEVLDVGENQFSDTFPRWLKSFNKLCVLVLRSNNFHGSIPCTSQDAKWPMLQIIDLAFNQFDGALHGRCLSDWSGMVVRHNETQLSRHLLQYRVFDSYYQDVVSITFKGSEFELMKILTVFSSIDLSSNKFSGKIPTVIGHLNSLKVLNLSHNGLSGSIPSSLANLTLLESLDLSFNSLSGEIPAELTKLIFLSALNLSYNRLMGRIATGNQLQTFDQYAYIGNEGLCGTPLGKCSTSNSLIPTRAEPQRHRNSTPATKFDWQCIFLGTGFGTGAALVVAPLMFSRKAKKWFDGHIYILVYSCLLAFGMHNTNSDEERPEPGDAIEHQLFHISGYYDDDNETKYRDDDQGRFCVFCSKLDIERRRVLHNPRCKCHGSPPTSLLSSSSSSS